MLVEVQTARKHEEASGLAEGRLNSNGADFADHRGLVKLRGAASNLRS